MKKKVLVIEDSEFIGDLIVDCLGDVSGCEVIGPVKEGAEALTMIEEHEPHLITLDNILPDMSGFQILEHIVEGDHQPKVIMVSGVEDKLFLEQAKLYGCEHIISKPFKRDEFVKAAKELIN